MSFELSAYLDGTIRGMKTSGKKRTLVEMLAEPTKKPARAKVPAKNRVEEYAPAPVARKAPARAASLPIAPPTREVRREAPKRMQRPVEYEEKQYARVAPPHSRRALAPPPQYIPQYKPLERHPPASGPAPTARREPAFVEEDRYEEQYEEEAPRPKQKMRAAKRPSRILASISFLWRHKRVAGGVAVACVLLYGYSAYHAFRDKQAHDPILRVKALASVPEEIPSVQIVTDPAKLKTILPNADVQAGDKLLSYRVARVIAVYRPSTDKIVFLMTIPETSSINSPATVPHASSTPASTSTKSATTTIIKSF